MKNDIEQVPCSFERGFEKGYEQAMVECSGSLDDTYLNAYKDGYYGKPPVVEDAKKSLFEVRKKIYKTDIVAEEQRVLALKILKVVDLLDEVQHQYTSDAMYEYLGYME